MIVYFFSTPQTKRKDYDNSGINISINIFFIRKNEINFHEVILASLYT